MTSREYADSHEAWLRTSAELRDAEARLAAAEAVVESAGELEFLDEPCSHLPLEMIDGVMEACDVCALRHALATYRKTTGSQQEAGEPDYAACSLYRAKGACYCSTGIPGDCWAAPSTKLRALFGVGPSEMFSAAPPKSEASEGG